MTKDHLDLKLAEPRTEMAELRGELRGEMEKLRGDLKAEIANQTRWLFGGLLGTAGLIMALIKLVP